MATVIAGVDVGGTKIQAASMDGDEVVGSARIATPETGVGDVVTAIVDAIRAALEPAGGHLEGVGIGVPGQVDLKAGTVRHSPNLRGFEGGDPIPLGSRVAAALGDPHVVLDNDVRVAMIGEHRHGAGRPYRDLLGVFVGTGVGGGIVLDGELWRGNRGAAGEIGHTMVEDGGRRCSCGREGHLEAYAGRACMQAHARRLVDAGHRTNLFDIQRKKGRPRVTSGVIAEAIRRGDELTIALVDDAVAALAVALSSASALLDVEAIVIGGGLGDRLGEPFVRRIADAMPARLQVPDRMPAMHVSELGDLSGAVGAAVMLRASVDGSPI